MNFSVFLYSGYNSLVDKKHRHRQGGLGQKNQKFSGVFNRCYNSLVDEDKQSQRQKVQADTFA